MIINNLTTEDIKFLKELKYELNTQSSRMTANPRMYQVRHEKFEADVNEEGNYFQVEYEGEVNIINDKKYRRGWWIFYTKGGKKERMLEFYNDGKNEIQNQRVVLDTIKDTIDKKYSFYFKNSVVVKNVDSIKVNIKYFTFDTTFDNILYIVDNEGNELKQVKSKTKSYDWDIKIDSNDPMIKTLLKSKKGKVKTYNYYEIRK